MTRVVVLNHYPVLPAANGGQHTVKAIALELAREWPTELIWTERKTRRSELLRDGQGRELTVTVLPNLWRQRKLSRLLQRALGYVDTDIGTLLCSGHNAALMRHLLARCRDGDVLLLAHPWLWPAVQGVLAQRRCTLVFDAHNVEYVLKAQAFRDGALGRWLVERTRRAEAEAARRADIVLACTPLDAGLLAEASGRPAADFMVGLRGIEPSPAADAVARARAAQPLARVAVFMGSKHIPNDEAARWIIDVLAPACPEWRFDIAGACGPAAGGEPGPNVRVLGHVQDLTALLADAGVALNPITLGSGINMKVFEYLQHGLPVISTPFGTRGLEGEDRRGLVISEREGYAAALRALAADPAQALELGRDGAAWVQARFTWPSIGERLRGRLRAVLAG